MRLFFSRIRWVFLPLFLFLVFSPLFASPVQAADAAAFVGETYPDAHPNGYDMEANTAFTKTWTLRNSGNTIWDSRYCLRYVGNNGNLISLSQNNVCIPAGTTVRPGVNYTFSINMRAPNVIRNGVREDWKFTNAAGVTIRVDQSNLIWVSLDVLCLINPSITVNYPNGGETWYKGKAYTITWNATPNISQLHMHLYKAGAFNRAFSNNAANDGSQSFTLTSDFPTGNDFKVGMSNVSALCDGAIADFSNNNFTIADPPAFAAPSIVSPANAAANVPLTPRLDWSDIASDAFGPGPDAYRVQIATDVNFNNIIRDQVINGAPPSSFYDVPAGVLNNNTTYYWRVRAGNAFRGGNWGSARFTTDPCNLAGASLTVTTPNGGENWVRGNVYAINWNSAGTIPNVAIKLYKNGVVLSTISASTPNDGSFNYSVPANVNAAVDYKIQLSNVDALPQCSGLVSDQSNNNFTVSNPPNFQAPGLLSPGNGATGIVRNPRFDWTDVAGAPNYDVEVATDNAFANVVASQFVAASQWDMPNGILNYATRYYWRVRAFDDYRWGFWSAVSTFTVQADPTAVATLVSQLPVQGTFLNSRQAFTQRWTIRNAGNVAWDANYIFRHTQGSLAVNASDRQLGRIVNPGESYDFTVNMVAPVSGQGIEDRWQFVSSQGPVVLVSGNAELVARINVNGSYSAEFVSETISDSTPFNPGASFVKSWTLINRGNVPWDNTFLLRRRVANPFLSQVAEVRVAGNIPVGGQYVFAVNMSAPANPGVYREDWELVAPDGSLIQIRDAANTWSIDRIWAIINVQNPDTPPDELPPSEGDNEEFQGISQELQAQAEANNIPPIILKGIAFNETGWQHVYGEGEANLNYCNGTQSQSRPAGSVKKGFNIDPPCVFKSVDLGLMQVSVKLSPATNDINHPIYEDQAAAAFAQEISNDWRENVDAAVSKLNGKWQLNIVGQGGCDEDKSIIENWYYPIAFYNGIGDRAYRYVGNVYNHMKGVTNLGDVDPYMESIPEIASPRILAGFPGTINEDGNQPYTLLQLAQNGGHIHRWQGGLNYTDITDQISNGTCESSQPNAPAALTQVQGLSPSQNGAQVSLSWRANPPGQGVQSYRVQWSQVDNNGNVVGQPQTANAGNQTSWSQNFNAGNYQAQVAAVKGAAVGPYSTFVQFNVAAQASVAPTPVSNVNASVDESDVTVTWDASPAGENVSEYQLHWRKVNGLLPLSGTETGLHGTSFTEDYALDGTYRVQMRACREEVAFRWFTKLVCGAYSNEVEFNVPDEGFDIQCKVLKNNEVLNGLKVAKGQVKNFCFKLPRDVNVMTVQMGGAGLNKDPYDADLYLKHSSPVSVNDRGKLNDANNPILISPYLDGSLETVTVSSPPSGKYYVAIHGTADMQNIASDPKVPDDPATPVNESKYLTYFLKLHYHTDSREGVPQGLVLNRSGPSIIFSPVDPDAGDWNTVEWRCANGIVVDPKFPSCDPHVTIDGSSGTAVVVPTEANQRNLSCYRTCRSDAHKNGDWDSLDLNLPGDDDDDLPLYAVFSGTVIYKANKGNVKNYGKEVVIQSDIDGNFSARYAHMDSWADGLTVGQHIEAGTQIGKIGGTGGFPNHLHFSLHKNLILNKASGTAMDQTGLKVDLAGGWAADQKYSAFVGLNEQDFLGLPPEDTTRWTVVEARCPVDMTVSDDQGNKLGYGAFGTIQSEIADAKYYTVNAGVDTFEMVELSQDVADVALVTLVGNAPGQFNVGISAPDLADEHYDNMAYGRQPVNVDTIATLDLSRIDTNFPLVIQNGDAVFIPQVNFNQDNLIQFNNLPPKIESLSVRVMEKGDELTITGANFGTLGSSKPGEIDLIQNNNLYRPFKILSWQDNQILVRLNGSQVPSGDYHLRLVVYPSRLLSNQVPMEVIPTGSIPVLDNVSPLLTVAGTPGIHAEFFGKGFTSDAQILVGGSVVEDLFVGSGRSIEGMLPVLIPGDHQVVIINGNGNESEQNVTIRYLDSNGDIDGDGLLNGDEIAAGTDLNNPDTDGDGVVDGADAFPADPTETTDADGDGRGDNSDWDDDNDGVDDAVDVCSGTAADAQVDANGCAAEQRGCAALADVRGNRFEAEICALVDAGYWPVAPGSHAFAPDAPLPLQEEIVVPVNMAGFGLLAQAEPDGICPGNPYFNFAIRRRILKPSMPGCPSPLSEQGLYRPILEAARALMQMDKDHTNYFWMVASQYDGPDIGALTNPHWIARDYYKYAYEMDALPDFDENRDPNDVMYGVQTVTRAQAAYIYYHMFHLDGLPERADLPESVPLEDDSIASLGFDAEFETDYPMKRGDFFGLALRLMKREGCVDYPDVIDNPFQDVPDDYEYLAELKKAVDMRLIKTGEGVSTTDPLGWKFNYTTYPTRRFESIVLSRLLSKVGACRTNCATIYNRERNNIHFSPNDPTATTYASYAVCMVALDGFPLAETDAAGLINTHFEAIPEAEESFITLYNVLQVQP